MVGGKIEVSAETSYTYTWNGSRSVGKVWAWKQPISVPPMTTIQATVTVAMSKVTVPYIMYGAFVFPDGGTAGAMQAGVYTGVEQS